MEDTPIKRQDITESIAFVYSALGEPNFIRKGDVVGNLMGLRICPQWWTSEELRTIADFMDSNPKCLLYNDGSENTQVKK